MLSEVLPEGKIQEETNIPLMQWEFHDLLFHTRSRLGRHDAPYGGTYRFLGKIDPLPGVKPPMSEEVIKLEQPDISSLTTTDVSFTQVLERRKSIREYGETSITKQQLGEFLYRTGRIKNTRQTELGELSERVYPSGGAIYELELYPLVHLCEGISSGLYHYCPQKHQLYGLSGATDPVARLLNNARMTMGNASNPPQVLIILAARFQRLAWKYQSMSYGLLLKHVGVLVALEELDLNPTAPVLRTVRESFPSHGSPVSSLLSNSIAFASFYPVLMNLLMLVTFTMQSNKITRFPVIMVTVYVV
ncbi:MAG: SagB family peptide dehydrogenase [Prochloron sp. SP5CPC1]|nr:SagB family peptide dehydrogenase [Candidatus Paraprochloron terpiosi SP5CPC1]